MNEKITIKVRPMDLIDIVRNLPKDRRKCPEYIEIEGERVSSNTQ